MARKNRQPHLWLSVFLFSVLLISSVSRAPAAFALDEISGEEYEEFLEERVESMSDEELEWFGDDIEEYGIEIVDEPEYGKKMHREEYLDYMNELEQQFNRRSGISTDDLGDMTASRELTPPRFVTLMNRRQTGIVQKLATSISPFTGKTYTHSTVVNGYTVKNYIDISYCDDALNFTKLAASGQVDGLIIRVGRTGYSNTKFSYGADSYFESHYKKAIAAGYSPVDVYYFSQATTVEEAKAEADFVLKQISGKKIDTVYFDYEYAYVSGGDGGRLYDAHLSKTAATNNANAFCQKIADAGYGAGVYASRYFFIDQLVPSSIANKYKIWVAEYNTKCNYNLTDIKMWQYSESGTVPGNNRNSDCNFFYIKQDYSAKSISLSKTSASLVTGGVVNLTASVNPTNTTDSVTWSTSNSSVATVSGGKVTATGVGTATITAKAGKVTATCKITVTAPVTTITLTGKFTFGPNIVLGVKDANITFTNSDPAKSASFPISYTEGGTTASFTVNKNTSYILSVTKGSHTSYTDKSFNPNADKIPDIVLYSGDIDGSGRIDITDTARIATSYNSVAGTDRYDSAADLSGDGRIDLIDCVIMESNYGKESIVIE